MDQLKNKRNGIKGWNCSSLSFLVQKTDKCLDVAGGECDSSHGISLQIWSGEEKHSSSSSASNSMDDSAEEFSNWAFSSQYITWKR